MTFKTAAATFALAALLPVAASAATAMVDGGVYDLSTDNEFNFAGNTGDANAADDYVSFGFASGGLVGATSFSVLLDAVNTDITEITATWSSGINGTGTVYETAVSGLVAGVAQILDFNTVFSAGDPQWFSLTWNGSDDNALISVEVAPVPVPAAGFLLLGGLGGLAAMKRRKKA